MRIRASQVVNGLIGVAAVVAVGTRMIPGSEQNGPVLTAVESALRPTPPVPAEAERAGVSAEVANALTALSGKMRSLSHPKALEDAFRSYFAYKAANPRDIKKPYLYFVDFGLPSTTARGYVFDMRALRIIEGPFTVAHGRGSSKAPFGIPTRFSNVHGSKATSLGLYVAQESYTFRGKSGGRAYTSAGLRMKGVSRGFNDNARDRRVVVHGAPYVTASRAGRSEGCPAMEQARAKRLLPMLANGAAVFLFAPDERWMAGDPWLLASGQEFTAEE